MSSRPWPSRWNSTSSRRWSSAPSDECVEVTPEIVRVRKVDLDATSRGPEPARAPNSGKAELSAPAGHDRAAADTLKGVPSRRTPPHCRRCAGADSALASRRRARSSAAARAAEHRHHGRRSSPPPPQATQIIMGIDYIGAGLQPAPAVGPVAGQCRDQRAGAAERVPAGARPAAPDRVALGYRPTLLVSAEVTSAEPVHGHLQDPARGVSGPTTRRSPPTTSGTCGGRWSASPASSTRRATT